ncbi:M55 family metallopeptidase [Candidatus Poribacteria bacterium]
MKLYMMTDLEGVAGVLNFQEWTGSGQPYYQLAREFLTAEVNAAVDGLFEGGATEILVADGHGGGAVNIHQLDPRAEYLRGWGAGPWPLTLDETFDALVFVGQHSKAGTEYGHLAHTQGTGYLDLSINGVSIGEFGQLSMCASEIGVRTIFGSGDKAFTEEAQKLVPGIETVAVKRGVKAGTGDNLTQEAYARFTASARHFHPVKARRLIREGALRAINRAQKEDSGIIELTPPFERVGKFRPTESNPNWTVSLETHPSSVIALMNTRFNAQPVENSG